MVIGTGFTDRRLSDAEIRSIMAEGLGQLDLAGKRVLVIIPDGTRSGPIPLFFRLFHEMLRAEVEALDYLLALGTHMMMTEEMICKRVGITPTELRGKYADVNIFNHHWEQPETFHTFGVIPTEEIEEISNGMMSQPVTVQFNRMILDYDQIIICGPVFPHEAAGFSGGNKYFIPGISGIDIINTIHWLGALVTCYAIIGVKDTPVRSLMNRAAAMIDRPKHCFAFVEQHGSAAGLYFGTPEEAWTPAADLSEQVHIRYLDRTYRQIISVMPEMYDDIWTASKGMYKVEHVLEDGGEIILYAPHITEFSYTHGKHVEEIGFHVRDYILAHWDRFGKYPGCVVSHSAIMSGIGECVDGVEKPRVQVTLATGISRERCERANLGYRDPASIDLDALKGLEDEGILVVPKAGETLFRLKGA